MQTMEISDSPATTRAPLGFTLIELMVVVAIIGIVASIAIPALRQSRKSGNEARAVASLRTVSGAQEMRRARTGSFGTLPDLASDGLVDSTFVGGTRAGYDYTDGAPSSFVWSLNADPNQPGETGDRSFFIDESGVIRVSTGGAASATDPALD